MSDNKDGFTPDDLARIVRWVIMLFFAYVILSTLPQFFSGDSGKNTVGNTVSTNPVNAPVNSAAESKNCEGSAFNNFSLFTIPLFPVSSPTVAVADIKVGTGESASCGQKATLRYTYATRGGDVIFSNINSDNTTKNVLIGGGEMLPGFERGLIDMKVGGERDISIPPELGFNAITKIDPLRDHEKFKFAGTTGILTARASLISLTPPLPSSSLKLRIVEQSFGNGKFIECGDTVYLKLTLWKMDGTSLFSNDASAPIRFTVGKSQLPYGVEQGVIGMMQDSKRTLIIPPSFVAPLDSSAESLLKGVSLPKNEIILAIVQVVSEPKPDTKPAPKDAEKSTEKK